MVASFRDDVYSSEFRAREQTNVNDKKDHKSSQKIYRDAQGALVVGTEGDPGRAARPGSGGGGGSSSAQQRKYQELTGQVAFHDM